MTARAVTLTCSVSVIVGGKWLVAAAVVPDPHCPGRRVLALLLGPILVRMAAERE